MAHQPPTISSTSFRIKTLAQAYIHPQVCHVVRALAYAKTLLIDPFRSKNNNEGCVVKMRRKKRKRTTVIFRAITMCCTRVSSHVLPMPEPSWFESHAYYDPSWNSMAPNDRHDGNNDMDPGVLSGHLQWLEEKENDGGLMTEDGAGEIDRLAEKFIASCHEKFRLEKQESYRRYQEMLARSL